jgi:hypothetical protein
MPNNSGPRRSERSHAFQDTYDLSARIAQQSSSFDAIRTNLQEQSSVADPIQRIIQEYRQQHPHIDRLRPPREITTMEIVQATPAWQSENVQASYARFAHIPPGTQEWRNQLGDLLFEYQATAERNAANEETIMKHLATISHEIGFGEGTRQPLSEVFLQAPNISPPQNPR